MPAPTQSFNFFTFIATLLLEWKYWGTVLNTHMIQLRKDSDHVHLFCFESWESIGYLITVPVGWMDYVVVGHILHWDPWEEDG